VKKARVPNLAPPRSDRVQVDDLATGVGESSSKDTQLDLSPPADDAKVHPQSSAAVAAAEAEALSPGGITELHSWDPHKAAKSIEVGDFYFRRKNYHAAEDRYREALRYKDNDAIATIRLAVCLEKLGIWDDARAEYESYLKILPHGPQAAEAQKAIDRLKAQMGAK
jgi:tetratricopeptide (TPR) repeat protein